MENIPLGIKKLVWYGSVNAQTDHKVLITHILNRGKFADVKWLQKNYPQSQINEVITKPLNGRWDKKSLNFWANMFKLKINDEIFNKAVFSVKNI